MPGFMPGIHVFFSIYGARNRVLTFTLTIAISTPPGTSGLLALDLESKKDDGIDTIERWP
jgi:hypothetical protein